MNYINHLKLGVQYPEHKGKLTSVSLGTNLNEYLRSLEIKDFEVGYIPAGYEHRPDLISYLFYDTVTHDWLIMMFNNIKDPFQELNVGDRILLPKM